MNYEKLTMEFIRKVTSSHVQVALQPHESKKLNLVALEKSDDFSYAIREVSNNGKIISQACNDCKAKSATEKYSLVKCKLLTGRTHQIRVHFAYIGHPLLGDSLYGKKSDLIEGQALHCYKLKFLHPVTSKEMVIKCDLSKKLNNILTNCIDV